MKERLSLKTLNKQLKEENTPQEDGQEQWLQDELLPFLTQLPQARSIKNPQQLFTVFVQKLETHPTAMDMTPEAREDMAKLALQQLGLVKDVEQLPFEENNQPAILESNMKLKQLIKEASEKGKAPEKGNKAIDFSSGLEKAKETTLNIDGENAGVIKHTDDMSDKVKAKIEALIKKHASSVKWEKDEMYWHFEMKDKIVARTRLTGLDWYEKPQELIDLENELRTLYNGFIGKITWNEAGEVCIPLKNVVLSENADPNNPITNPMRTQSVKPASYDPKSALERVAQDIWKEPNVAKAKLAFTDFLATTKINDNSKKVMLTALQSINSKPNLDRYVANALLKFEKLGMNQLSKGPMAEGKKKVASNSLIGMLAECDCEMDEGDSSNTEKFEEQALNALGDLAKEKGIHSKVVERAWGLISDGELYEEAQDLMTRGEHPVELAILALEEAGDREGEEQHFKAHPELNP